MRTLLGLAGMTLTLAAIVLAAPSRAADEKDGFTALFDGKSFEGWTFHLKEGKDGKKPDPKETWSVVDGTIRCVGKPNGYLLTKKEYGDYVLKVKWRFPADSKGGNSGVLLHCQDEKLPWPTSV